MKADQARQIKQVLKLKLSNVMMKHVGRNRAIGMGELFQIVFGRSYDNRINDTRGLRTLITALRFEGVDICSCDQGYYLSSASSELIDYHDRTSKRALKTLAMIGHQRKISAEELAGQLVLPLQAEMHALEYKHASGEMISPAPPRIPGGGKRGNSRPRRSPGGRSR